ncbi:unnamed protein product [Protopolystoma xenopodis]|uniref:Uncharacterized protein n=1 Tax=Protopolystoma xenopodis TaxID=117903 RepID=A0A448WD52_9PLAT|nr:unnamed protein product [Protopolystoma xenopodis]
MEVPRQTISNHLAASSISWAYLEARLFHRVCQDELVLFNRSLEVLGSANCTLPTVAYCRAVNRLLGRANNLELDTNQGMVTEIWPNNRPSIDRIESVCMPLVFLSPSLARRHTHT